MYYRIRTRMRAVGGETVIVADNIPTLERAYEIVVEKGKGTSRHFSIDEVEPKMFSKLTAKIAESRLDEIRAIREEMEIMKNADG